MIEYGYTPDYLTRDGKPWFPIMGEIHYSRYPQTQWKEALYKMKAGGITVVSTYVFWLHHEEREGIYRFDGSRNLKQFVETCRECGMKMVLRVGPWCHGEARNGGFPDWLMQKPFKLRENNPGYLQAVERLWIQVFDQVKGQFHGDGGPIIGIQIENEYGHVGGLDGEEGENHMIALTQLAKRLGFLTPLYTATGWGGAVTGGLIPVMGGYCEAPWDQRLIKIEPSVNYVFSHERNDGNIGSDHAFGTGITYDISKFPFLTAELGGGLQVTHHRRPVVTGDDIGAMSMTKLGSGVNLLGYYMYHGGSNPKGELSTLQESRATGYPNDVPQISYDFQAPIGEFGQINGPYKTIKRLALFIEDFGQELCTMKAIIPTENPTPKNLSDLRYAYRHDGRSGYLFVNNYQRVYTMAEHDAASFKIKLNDSTVEFPPMAIQDKDYFFYPFRMQVGDGLLDYAMATPLCRLKVDEEDVFVFYSNHENPYSWIKKPKDTRIITIADREALNANKVKIDNRDYLIISEAVVLQTEKGIETIEMSPCTYKIYPRLAELKQGWAEAGRDGEFYLYRYEREVLECPNATFELKESDEGMARYEIKLGMPEDKNLHDYFLILEYAGDSAELYLDGEKIADHFYTGRSWQIGLKRFNYPKILQLKINVLKSGDPVYLENWPDMTDGSACRLENAQVSFEGYFHLAGL